MRPDHDPSALIPDQRRGDIARLLATGILRLHARGALPVQQPTTDLKNLAQSAPAGLELPDDSRLSVQEG